MKTQEELQGREINVSNENTTAWILWNLIQYGVQG